MWFSGNTKLATLPDNAPISQALTKEQIDANGLEGKTVGEVRNGLRTRRMAATTTVTPATVVKPAPEAAPTAAPTPVAAPAPAATTTAPTTAGTLPPPPAHPSSFAAPLQSTGNRGQDILNIQAQEATQKANIAAEEQGKKKFAEEDYAKKSEYANSIGTASNTFDELDKLLTASRGQKKVFNLAGQGFVGPAAAWLFHKEKAKGESDETEHDTVARHLLNNEDMTSYKNIKQGAAVAQAAWAKKLIEGAGGRLTNADLNLGKIAKGVGVETTYESHMINLAKQMEAAKTAQYRGEAFKQWVAQHPGQSVAEFESTPEQIGRAHV